MVVSASDLASDAGASILRKGGNAVDAAIATAFAMAVTYPGAGNVGGGGFMVVAPKSGSPVAIDYRERAPLASTPGMYLKPDGTTDYTLTASGWLAPGVPGTVRGLELAHKKFGKLKWSELVEPAVRLARGFRVSANFARDLNAMLAGPLSKFPSSVAAYGKPGGGKWAEGDTIQLTDLARTLEAIAKDGPDAFYKGWIADSIAVAMRANGGIISKQDLAEYQARARTPVRGKYRGHEIISMAPPSSGGIVIVEALNILEPFDLRSRGRYNPTTTHLIIEAMRRAFLDRARFSADPDFVDVPVKRLTSAAYAGELRVGIDTLRASSSVALGRDIVTDTVTTESRETTHFSVVDGDGMAVSNTYTLEQWYGSSVVVPGTGVLLNNEMGDFNKRPGFTSVKGDIGTRPNLIEPGKRMLSSMTPTIVRKDGKVVLVTGSPGGRTIPNTVLNIVLNFVEFGMPVREAVSAARLHMQWLPDEVLTERKATDPEIETLRAMGHKVRTNIGLGDGHSISIDPATGVITGARDMRSRDSKASAP
jgi:gamma-glutamyltranspeptidase/glutathione hydrolase